MYRRIALGLCGFLDDEVRNPQRPGPRCGSPNDWRGLRERFRRRSDRFHPQLELRAYFDERLAE